MLLDANVLLYAVDLRSPYHRPAADLLEELLNGAQRVALPWQSIGAFLRISTHPRAAEHPLTAAEAFEHVEQWMSAQVAWMPPVSARTTSILGGLVRRYQLTGNLIPDAQLAALAIEHGLVLCSNDSDFARFKELRWHNPLRDCD